MTEGHFRDGPHRRPLIALGLGVLVLALLAFVAIRNQGTVSPVAAAQTAVGGCFSAPTRDAPRYIPPGYHLRARLTGPDGASFPGDPTQVLWTFSTSCDNADVSRSLTVAFVSNPTARLFATAPDRNQAVDVGVAGTTAVYHDGITALTGTANPPAVAWDVSAVNSLTIHWSGGTYGIRGSRAAGASRAELIRIARALDYIYLRQG